MEAVAEKINQNQNQPQLPVPPFKSNGASLIGTYWNTSHLVVKVSLLFLKLPYVGQQHYHWQLYHRENSFNPTYQVVPINQSQENDDWFMGNQRSSLIRWNINSPNLIIDRQTKQAKPALQCFRLYCGTVHTHYARERPLYSQYMCRSNFELEPVQT